MREGQGERGPGEEAGEIQYPLEEYVVHNPELLVRLERRPVAPGTQLLGLRQARVGALCVQRDSVRVLLTDFVDDEFLVGSDLLVFQRER